MTASGPISKATCLRYCLTAYRLVLKEKLPQCPVCLFLLLFSVLSSSRSLLFLCHCSILCHTCSLSQLSFSLSATSTLLQLVLFSSHNLPFDSLRLFNLLPFYACDVTSASTHPSLLRLVALDSARYYILRHQLLTLNCRILITVSCNSIRSLRSLP